MGATDDNETYKSGCLGFSKLLLVAPSTPEAKFLFNSFIFHFHFLTLVILYKLISTSINSVFLPATWLDFGSFTVAKTTEICNVKFAMRLNIEMKVASKVECENIKFLFLT